MLPFLCPYPCLDFPFVFQQAAQDSALIKMQSLKAAKKKKKNPQGNSEKKKKITMSHSASACLVGWKFPHPWVSLREFNLAS